MKKIQRENNPNKSVKWNAADDFSINNNYGGIINKSMKKQKKLLIKNISNSNKDNNSISRKKK